MTGNCVQSFLALCGTTSHGELLEFPHGLRQLLKASHSSSRKQLLHLIHHWCGKATPRGNVRKVHKSFWHSVGSLPWRITGPHHLRQLLEASPSSSRRQLPHLMHHWCGKAGPTGNGGELCTSTTHRELLEFPHHLRQLLEASPSSTRRQLPRLIHHWCGKSGSRGNGGELCTIILGTMRTTTHGELLEFPQGLRQLLKASPSST